MWERLWKRIVDGGGFLGFEIGEESVMRYTSYCIFLGVKQMSKVPLHQLHRSTLSFSYLHKWHNRI